MLLRRLFTAGQISGVRLLRGGPRQNFSPRVIERGVGEGWLSLANGKVTLKSDPPAIFRIVQSPGYYCCHCRKVLDGGSAAREHIAVAHAGKMSPDPANPAGYRRDNFYATVKES